MFRRLDLSPSSGGISKVENIVCWTREKVTLLAQKLRTCLFVCLFENLFNFFGERKRNFETYSVFSHKVN